MGSVVKGGFGDFIKSIKGLSGFEKATVNEATEILRLANSGVSSVDEALRSLPVTLAEKRYLLLGEETAGTIHKVLREADLPELIRISKRDIPYNSSEVREFRQVVGNTPELKHREVLDASAARKKQYPHLDATEEELPLLSNNAKADVKRVESNLRKYFRDGTTIALTIGVVYVGVDWIAKTTQLRRGCFMLTTIDNKTASCKVASYSCIGSNEGPSLCPQTLNYYNVTLQLMAIAELEVTNPRLIDVAAIAEIPPAEFKNRINEVIDKKYLEVAGYIDKTDPKLPVDVCALKNPKVEDGQVPPCRLCSPSDNPISTTFIDPNQYPDNVTFQCVINPSILDTITDATINTGKDLFDGLTKGIGYLLKPLLIIGGIFLILAIIAFIVIKVLSSSSARRVEQQSATAAAVISDSPITAR